MTLKKMRILVGSLLWITLLFITNCKSPLKAVESSGQVATVMSVIPIPKGYETVRKASSYVQLKKEKAFIRVCESYPDSVVNSCDIMLLPLRGTRSDMRSSKITSGKPYMRNGFEITYLQKLDPGGKVTHAYKMYSKKGAYRLIFYGTGLSPQEEHELKWMVENCYRKE